jgi:hypothetical protein
MYVPGSRFTVPLLRNRRRVSKLLVAGSTFESWLSTDVTNRKLKLSSNINFDLDLDLDLDQRNSSMV